MLQSASNWTLVRGEVLLKKLYVTLAWGGLSYSLGALVIEYLSGKTQGSAMPSAQNSGSQKCFALVWMLSPHHAWSLRKEHPSGGRTWPGHPGYAFHVLCWSLTLTTAHLHGGFASRHNCNRNEPPLWGKSDSPSSSQCSHIVVVNALLTFLQ